MQEKPLILILCTGNSGRSHLAEGILAQRLPKRNRSTLLDKAPSTEVFQRLQARSPFAPGRSPAASIPKQERRVSSSDSEQPKKVVGGISTVSPCSRRRRLSFKPAGKLERPEAQYAGKRYLSGRCIARNIAETWSSGGGGRRP
jgi:hypothetical protein